MEPPANRDPLEREVRQLREQVAELQRRAARFQDPGAGPRSSVSEREELLLEAERTAHVGSWAWDVSTDAVSWSDELFRILGYDPATDRASTEAFFAAVHPDDRERLREASRRGVSTGIAAQVDFRILHRDGVVRHATMGGSHLFDSNGALRRIVGTVLDVTERHREEAAHRRSEQRLAFVLDLARRIGELEEKEVFDRAAEEAARLTGSRSAYLHLVDDDQRALTLTSWNQEALRGSRAVTESHCPLGAAGVWADSVRLRRPVIHDETQADPGRPAWPEGHSPVRRHLGVPVLDGDEVRLVIGVGNRADPYSVEDAATLTALGADVLQVVMRRRAEVALRSSEQRFRLLAEHAQDVIYRYRLLPEPGFDYVSPSVTMLTGYTPEDHYADPLLGQRLIHPEDRPLLERVRATPAADSALVLRWIRRDGSPLWMEQRNVAVHDEAGRLVAIEGIARDISGRVFMEQALRQGEQRLRAMFEQNAVGVCEATLDGVILSANRAFAGLLGYAPEELVGRPQSEITHPADHAASAAALASIRGGGSETFTLEKRYLRRDGGIVTAQVTASLLRDPHGRPAGLVAIVQDVSGRRQAEQALRDSEENYRRFVEGAPYAVLVHEDDRIVYANRAAARLAGAAGPEALLGHSALDLLDPSERGEARQEWLEVLASNAPGPWHEHRLLALDGLRQVEAMALPLEREGQRQVHVVMRDIGPRKRIESWLRGQRTLLEQVVRGEPLPEVLARLAELVESHVANAAAAVLLLDQEGTRLNVAAAPGLSADYRAALGGARVADADVPCGAAVARRARVVVTDLARDPLGARVREVALRHGFPACWAIPLVSGRGTPLGALGVHLRAPRGPSEEEAHFLDGLAPVAALAIERSRSERMILAAADEWMATFDALEAAVLVLDGADRVARVNSAAACLIDAPAAACAGRPLATLGEGEPWSAAVAAVATLHAGGHVEMQRVRDLRGGSWEVDATLAPGRDGQEERVILTLRDVTRLADLQESIVRSERMAAMGSLVAGVAHEVRNPLFAMSVNIDALDAVLADRNEVRDLVDALREERDRISHLMSDLLSYGRPQPLVRSPGPLAAVLQSALRSTAPLAARLGVRLERPEALPDLTLSMDRGRLEEVFDNLLDNACQHTLPGRSVRVSVLRVADEEGAWAEIEVADDGPGFSAEALGRACEPFFTRRRGGTGLGLAIAQRIDEEHGGRIALGNRPGGGGVVSVWLPLAAPAAARGETA